MAATRGAKAGKASSRRPSDDRAAPVPPEAISAAPSTPQHPQGTLVIIGGREDKQGERVILKEVVARSGQGPVVVATISSGYPREQWTAYSGLFRELGAKDVSWLDLEERGGAFGEKAVALLESARAVFFTGGDQVRITSRLAGTPLDAAVRALYQRGGVVAGTSAGATAMSEVMLIAGDDQHVTRIKTSLHMAPGLGLVPGVIIDQHFAERGRLTRLVGAVAQNPRMLGIGIDENTAIVVEGDRFQVLGAGTVHVVDALGESYTNLSEADGDSAMTVFDLRLHILSAGARFDLTERRPHRAERRQRAAGVESTARR